MTPDPVRGFAFKRHLLDAIDLERRVRRMATEIVERERDLEALMLVGIRTRGLPLAERLADAIEAVEGRRPPVGALDITLYRDDLSVIGPQPLVKGTDFPGPIEDRVIVLCDDVLYTGRTVRAALDELSDWGRPRAVRLAVLVDRGHRELPIQPDVVGKRIETARSELIEVAFTSIDGEDSVRLLERRSTEPSAGDQPG
ncbi:MAG: bifunctional pyr operon transcriptional regulator/uracil phosphoribosyltransferase PyrR [Acidobacteriota bacterium]